ncbi:MAG: hypothetical protein V4714_17780 [Bacteroidota bacterium]
MTTTDIQPKERGMLFSTPMVIALQNDSKTQTRRTVKFPKDCYQTNASPGISSYGLPCLRANLINDVGYDEIHCPYGKVGDIIWVRETFAIVLENKWGMIDGAQEQYTYKADKPSASQLLNPVKWKPSLFMPKEACRLRLEITDIRVERLNDISEEDAKAEGYLKMSDHPPMAGKKQFEYNIHGTYKKGYECLWEQINGADSWAKNDFVWVITFRKLYQQLA